MQSDLLASQLSSNLPTFPLHFKYNLSSSHHTDSENINLNSNLSSSVP